MRVCDSFRGEGDGSANVGLLNFECNLSIIDLICNAMTLLVKLLICPTKCPIDRSLGVIKHIGHESEFALAQVPPDLSGAV